MPAETHQDKALRSARGAGASTIQQVAKAAGVAVPTAYQALRGGGTLADATRSRVMEAAVRLGFQVNAAARAVREGRFHSIGLVMAAGTGAHIGHDTLGAILRVSRQQGSNLILAELPPLDVDGGTAAGASIPRVLQEISVDGLLVYDSGRFGMELEAVIKQQPLPAVWIDRNGTHDSVFVDDFGAARKAVSFLVEQGHRRITLAVARATEHHSYQDRHRGYIEQMVESGLEPRVVSVPGEEWITDHEARELRPVDALADRLFDSPLGRPTAILTYDEFIASLTLRLARQKGLTVPHDLSITSFASLGPLPHASGLDMWRIPQDELGEYATEMLLQRINGGGESMPSRRFDLAHVRGRTVGPPAA